MAVTTLDMYTLRSMAKIALPQIIQDNIAKLRITPMVFKPFHKPANRQHHRKPDNWREKALVDAVRRVREREDPEYSEIFAIFNKITLASLEKLSNEAVGYIQKRDESFRLRVATLLFDKAITQHAFAAVMAECANRISTKIPELKEDIQAQVAMFRTLYNINETLTFPHSSDPDFDNKVIECTKQKEKRRGYAKFMMELHIRNIVSEECVKDGLKDIVNELVDMVKQPVSPQTEENAHQFAVFLYETGKLTKPVTGLRSYLKESIGLILKLERTTVPSLSMKSRFKLEDAFKLVQ
jgi:hypothetical protein